MVKTGAQVVEGQPLIRFDADRVARKAKSLLTMMVLSHSDRIDELKVLGDECAFQNIKSRDPLIRIQFRTESKGALESFVESVGLPHRAPDHRVLSDLLVIQNPNGIHARPASVLVGLAKKYGAEVFLTKGE